MSHGELVTEGTRESCIVQGPCGRSSLPNCSLMSVHLKFPKCVPYAVITWSLLTLCQTLGSEVTTIPTPPHQKKEAQEKQQMSPLCLLVPEA